MTSTEQINDVISVLDALKFQLSGTIRTRLFSIIFRIDCAEYCVELLSQVDFAQVNHFSEMNQLINGSRSYEFGTRTTKMICFDGPKLAFHVKRLVLEILVSLDNAVDVMWKCVTDICNPDPPFRNTPNKGDLIGVIASTKTPLAMRDFVKEYFEKDKDFGRAINSLRNLFTHEDYLVRNDIEGGPRELAYGQVEFNGTATFNFAGDDADLNLAIKKADREYNTFCRRSLTRVKRMFEAFLAALETDLNGCTGVPFTYKHNQN